MTSPSQFHGWIGHDKSAAQGTMAWSSFSPKPFHPIDIDIKISHCGICGSDIHTLRGGWGNTHYPVCVGHEIIGHVVRVGASVQGFQLGDRVGVGAQVFSCLKAECEECSSGREQHCSKTVSTYNTKYPDGTWSMGGYADYIRVPAHFALKIPAALKSEDAAPMMCGGITVYAPLRNNGAGPGKRAMGADKVVAISRRRNKVEDAMAMGADVYIATSEDEKWARKHSRSLDLIISTVSSPDMPLESYLRLLRTGGQFIQVGAPEDKLPPIAAFGLIGKGCKIGGSQIGSPKDIEEMLKFAAEKGVKPWVQTRSMREANQAVVEMEDGKARYRYVLVNPDHTDRAKI
ncbi:alcohol dehydrogenase-like protein [Phaeosphaeriaceae sp. PMI808]|nr:alcohol dehydrogenase-like protein [Phaeosphaeriaceae sp. PMI808]